MKRYSKEENVPASTARRVWSAEPPHMFESAQPASTCKKKKKTAAVSIKNKKTIIIATTTISRKQSQAHLQSRLLVRRQALQQEGQHAKR
jgi:hypothetical protein